VPALAVLLAAAYAVSDEFHQIFVPGRSAALFDVALDSAAALAGVLASALLAALHRSATDRAAPL